jgi:hypothetical protein
MKQAIENENANAVAAEIPIKNLVWKGNAGHLALVMVHGEPVVRDGRHLKADETGIMRTAAVAARKIWNIAFLVPIVDPWSGGIE